MKIRKAKIKDTHQIREMINYYADKNLMLPRSLSEIYENLQAFFVIEEKGKAVGCCALYIIWEDLAEIKSLAVKPSHTKKGLGAKLIQRSLAEAKKLGIKKVFSLTYIPDFFAKFGFNPVPKENLPHKIWGECIHCRFFPDCKEVPTMKVL